MNTVDWIETNLPLKECNSEEFFYDEMESQSGFSLPLLYLPFDVNNPGHWLDRGAALDFLYATQGEGKRLLDFGPGDGWPSLIVAPFAGEVVGIDGSLKRRDVCEANAARMGITNACFLRVPPGEPLPFPDHSFDGAMAASSIEQSPDPRFTLREIFRVLKPGGRLRIHYESLGVYRGENEHVSELEEQGEACSRLVIYDRRIEQEQARHYKIDFNLPLDQAQALFGAGSPALDWQSLTLERLEQAKKHITAARALTLTHPSGLTFVRWMKEAGFAEALPTHNGLMLARRLFDILDPGERPTTMEALDAYLKPLVKIVVEMEAPGRSARGWDPMITAVKGT